MAVPPEILRLIECYKAQREAYQSGQYKETQICVEFIDPFFKAKKMKTEGGIYDRN